MIVKYNNKYIMFKNFEFFELNIFFFLWRDWDIDITVPCFYLIYIGLN